MADSSSSQDRQLPATERKLEKAREDGQIARSRDLGHFAAIAAGGALVVAAAPLVAGAMRDALAGALRFDRTRALAEHAMADRLGDGALQWAFAAVPFGLAMIAVALGASAAMSGVNWTWKPLQPKLSVLNPIAGLGRVFSKQQVIDALKASLLALLLCGIGAAWLYGHADGFTAALSMPLPAAIASGSGLIVSGLVFLVGALAVFALIDVPLQKRLHANQLKMSHQEVKQENKEQEGNAEVKGKVKARMREMTKRRMLAAVPQADLVVMNPTHYAVALRYDDTKMGAPRVTAKGADLLALKIRDVAKQSKVPVLDAPMLARALYAHAEIDREIPAALFAAVAQVLAYVYQLRAALGGRGAMPGELPALDVPRELDPHEKAHETAHGKTPAADL